MLLKTRSDEAEEVEVKMRRLFIAMFVVVGSVLAAQVLSFEVASIKHNVSGPGPQFIRNEPNGRIIVTNMPVEELIKFAYQLTGFQLLNVPKWARSVPQLG